MSRRAWRYATLVVGLALLAGCARLQRQERMTGLEDSLRAYSSAVRWGHYGTALSLLRRRDGTPVEPRAGFAHNVHVTDYEVTAQQVLAEETEAMVLARITYFSTDTAMVKSITDEQHWWYEPDSRHWFLDGDLPAVFYE